MAPIQMFPRRIIKVPTPAHIRPEIIFMAAVVRYHHVMAVAIMAMVIKPHHHHQQHQHQHHRAIVMNISPLLIVLRKVLPLLLPPLS